MPTEVSLNLVVNVRTWLVENLQVFLLRCEAFPGFGELLRSNIPKLPKNLTYHSAKRPTVPRAYAEILFCDSSS